MFNGNCYNNITFKFDLLCLTAIYMTDQTYRLTIIQNPFF